MACFLQLGGQHFGFEFARGHALIFHAVHHGKAVHGIFAGRQLFLRQCGSLEEEEEFLALELAVADDAVGAIEDVADGTAHAVPVHGRADDDDVVAADGPDDFLILVVGEGM